MKIINIEDKGYGDVIYTIKPFKNRTGMVTVEVDRWNRGKKPIKCYSKGDKVFSNPKIHHHQFADINAPLSENTIKAYVKCKDGECDEVEKLLKDNNIFYGMEESLRGFEGEKIFEIRECEWIMFSYKPSTTLKKWINDYGLSNEAVVWSDEKEFLIDGDHYSWDDVRNLNKICRNSYMSCTFKLRRKYGLKEFKSRVKSFINAPLKYRICLKDSEQSNLKHLVLPLYHLKIDKLNVGVNWYIKISEV